VTSPVLRLGTRGSKLALWQAEWVRAALARAGTPVEIVVIKTQGDAQTDRPLHQLEGSGFFTKAIEDALLAGHVDIAVHSLKDLPTRFPGGLALGAVPARHDPAEALVARDAAVNSLDALPAGGRVGTSSLRRSSQLRYRRPDLDVVSLRGNVPTRVDKVATGADGLDAALLALAGLARLGLGASVTARLDPLDLMPAPGQGALGIEVRDDDRRAAAALQPLHHAASHAAVAAERGLLAALGGGCQAPVGAWVDTAEGRLYGRVTASDGAVQLTASAALDPQRPLAAAETVAHLLESQGASKLLAR
jgi:hydroxymethylbilane synthase